MTLFSAATMYEYHVPGQIKSLFNNNSWMSDVGLELIAKISVSICQNLSKFRLFCSKFGKTNIMDHFYQWIRNFSSPNGEKHLV